MNKNTNSDGNQVANITDPFSNLEAFKVSQDFNEFETQIDYSNIPLRKPGKQQWFRAHPTIKLDNVCFLEVDQEDGRPESFLLTSSVVAGLSDLPGFSKRSIRLCVSRPNNSPFVWPIKMPRGSGSKHDEWSKSAIAVADLAETEWVRIQSDMVLGAYKHITANAGWEEPVWPLLDIGEILRRSVGEQHIIGSADHPVVRELRGLA